MGEMRNMYKMLIRKLNGRDHLEDGRIILPFISCTFQYRVIACVVCLPSIDAMELFISSQLTAAVAL